MSTRTEGSDVDTPLQRRYGLAVEVDPVTEGDAPTVDEQGRRLSTGIEGVVYSRAVTHIDHRGSLTEAVNLEDPFWDEPIVYTYCFTIRPGRIKGWGMHYKQADRYFLVSGSVRVVLYDGRRRSPTYRSFAEFHLTEASRAPADPAGGVARRPELGGLGGGDAEFPDAAVQPRRP